MVVQLTRSFSLLHKPDAKNPSWASVRLFTAVDLRSQGNNCNPGTGRRCKQDREGGWTWINPVL